ncbi:transcriptional regulator [Caudoviricetes sp.]|nr:transcriptional regulator [Caudoviricetes sp.]
MEQDLAEKTRLKAEIIKRVKDKRFELLVYLKAVNSLKVKDVADFSQCSVSMVSQMLSGKKHMGKPLFNNLIRSLKERGLVYEMPKDKEI